MRKKVFITLFVLLALGIAGIVYVFNLKYADSKKETADFTVNASTFINEFAGDNTLANKKYSEKIISVSGRVSSTEQADTTINIKMEDSTTGNYIIFAFQNQYLKEAKQINEGDSVVIKGSCSGGIYSEILESSSVSFKRCTLMEKVK